ncbi:MULTISPECIES: hypothetical protein [Acinetobacter]|uniref:hypothetical protein n=1 Tax=Acinetobacter TaxID=469 RepID=UPI0015D1B185|nr:MULTISPECIES: hypothetical protein [Acinetobacter]
MPTIEEKHLALEMADKIIKTRLACKGSQYMRENIQSGDISYWEQIYNECLKIVTKSD